MKWLQIKIRTAFDSIGCCYYGDAIGVTNGAL